MGTLHFSYPCHITIMTLLAPNYDINMTSFPRHTFGWVRIIISNVFSHINEPDSICRSILKKMAMLAYNIQGVRASMLCEI